MNELVKVSYKFTEQIILTWHKAENSLLTRSGDVKKQQQQQQKQKQTKTPSTTTKQ